jgi:hypothetical protein
MEKDKFISGKYISQTKDLRIIEELKKLRGRKYQILPENLSRGSCTTIMGKEKCITLLIYPNNLTSDQDRFIKFIITDYNIFQTDGIVEESKLTDAEILQLQKDLFASKGSYSDEWKKFRTERENKLFYTAHIGEEYLASYEPALKMHNKRLQEISTAFAPTMED